MKMANRQRLLKLARRLELWAKQLRAYERKNDRHPSRQAARRISNESGRKAVMMEEHCRVCDKEYAVPLLNRRRVCCDGRDCGCGGETIPNEFCSAECYENYDPTPWCSGCGAMKQKDCHCGPIADND